MVWTDWGRRPRLERAGMDGSNRLLLANEGVGWPNGVTIDPQTQRVIWVDAKSEVLFSSVCLYLSVYIFLSVCLYLCMCVFLIVSC